MNASASLDLVDPPVLDVDPFSDEVLADPYPFFEQLREAGPVAYIQPHGFYAVGRYEEVTEVATDHTRFTVEGGVGMSDIRRPGAWRATSPIAEVDPPQHAQVRAALQKVLSPVVIRQWKDEFDKHAQTVIERALDEREVDGVRDLAEGFVLGVFPRLLGIDVPAQRLVMTGELNFNQLGPNNARLQRSLEKTASIMDWYAAQLKRDKMLPGGFGARVYAAEDAGEFAKGTAEAHVRTFFRAGVDTSMAGIGFALNQLARHPDQFQAVRDDPSKVRNAFEEAIRHESPAQILFRTTVGEVELSGVRLEPDTKVGIYFGSANRDPRQWANPDQYDIHREVMGRHRGFGVGPHMCIGQTLARFEAEALLGTLMKRVKSIELNGPSAYRLINALRSLDTLPLRLTPA